MAANKRSSFKGMAKYIKCPRCELNYIVKGDDLCKVCKAEMKLEGYTLLEEDEAEVLCPVCKTNILDDGEKICLECRVKKEQKQTVESDVEDPVEHSVVSEDETLTADGAEFVKGEEEGESIEEELSKAGFFEVAPEELGLPPEAVEHAEEEEETEEETFESEEEDLEYVSSDELDDIEDIDEEDEEKEDV